MVVGRARGALQEVAVEYEARIARLAKFDAVVVKDEPLEHGTPAEIRRREGQRLLAATEGWTRVAFDRAGRDVSSEQLAALVNEFEERRPQKTAFLIGGAEGFSPEVLDACAHRFALGSMTLPHQLARVVATEQIYRALTINRGLPYHR